VPVKKKFVGIACSLWSCQSQGHHFSDIRRQLH